MLGLILPAVLFVLLGVVQGGSLARWSALHVRGWPLAAACLLMQVALFSPLLESQPLIVAYGPWLYVLSLAGVGATLLANARAEKAAHLPLTLAALGVALNCLVIVANGGYMPRSDKAAASLGMPSTAQLMQERLVNVEPLGGQTRLGWLGDTISEPRWLPLANVVSIGDLLLSAGLAWWAFRVTAASDGGSARNRQAGADAAVSSLN
jgi:uncharacterized protein DUF5317